MPNFNNISPELLEDISYILKENPPKRLLNFYNLIQLSAAAAEFRKIANDLRIIHK